MKSPDQILISEENITERKPYLEFSDTRVLGS
jgi:hypothetical protein